MLNWILQAAPVSMVSGRAPMKVLRSDLRLPSKILLDDPTSADSALDLFDLDERKHDYVTAIKPAFDCLRDVAAQVAGLLVLAVSGSKSAAGHPMLPVALESHPGAVDLLGTAGCPPPGRATNMHTWCKPALNFAPR